MKRKVSIVILCVLAVIACMFAVSGCSDNDNSTSLLSFSLGSEGTYYFVSDCDDQATQVEIPTTYNSLPVTNIGSYAFAYCTSLESVIIPNSVTDIGDYAFARCSKLTSIALPNSVTSIGNGAFSNCEAEIKWGDSPSITEIGDNAFRNYNGTNIIIPNSVMSIGDSAFKNCSSLISVTIGRGVTSVGSSAFSDCSSLISVSMTGNVTEIGSRAFSGCTSLENIYYIGTIMDWCAITFSGTYNSLTDYSVNLSTPMQYASHFYTKDGDDWKEVFEITIPNVVTKIGDYQFYGFDNITSITIPDSVKSIGRYAFSKCYKLIEICNLSSLSIIAGSTDNGYVGFYAKNIYTATDGESKITHTSDGYTFYEDGDIVYLMGYIGTATELILPDVYHEKSYEIYQYAFYHCASLVNVAIGNGVTSIGGWAFYACPSLMSIIIPVSVESIGYRAFISCNFLSKVYYCGTKLEWKNIVVYDDDSSLTSATRYYYSESEPSLNSAGTAYDGNYWHYVDGEIVVWEKSES